MAGNVLYRTLKVGQNITIGDAVVYVEYKTGQQVRLRIESPETVVINQGARVPLPTQGDDHGTNHDSRR